MALVDWHDFVVVETIDFADEEEGDLPQPLSREEVIRLSRQAVEDEPEEPATPAEKPAAAAAAAAGAMDADEVAMVQASLGAATLDGKDGAGATAAGAAEQHDEDEEDEEMEIEEDGYLPPPPPEVDGPVKIVRNYKRPEERAAAEAAAEGEPASAATQFVVSPITGELVPVAEMAEHMRVSLIDPKYKEQKERMMAKLRENTLASDDEISRNINHLATTRPDIFGTTEEEVSNAVRAESEKLSAVAAAVAAAAGTGDEAPAAQRPIIWDGHTGSIGRTAAAALAGQGALGLVPLPGDDGSIGLVGPPPVEVGPAPPPKLAPLRPLPPPPGLPVNMPKGVSLPAPSAAVAAPQLPRPLPL
eukprot:SM004287S15705  [mRNA]  locus=s4287:1:1211:- [translate_table: standard]